MSQDSIFNNNHTSIMCYSLRVNLTHDQCTLTSKHELTLLKPVFLMILFYHTVQQWTHTLSLLLFSYSFLLSFKIMHIHTHLSLSYFHSLSLWKDIAILIHSLTQLWISPTHLSLSHFVSIYFYDMHTHTHTHTFLSLLLSFSFSIIF